MNVIKPKFVKNVKNIAIFSLSNKDDIMFPIRYNRAITNLKKTYDNVLEWKNEEKPSEQLINMLKNDNIDMLMSLTGGYTTNTHLDSIDYKTVTKFPKAIIGYSDTTALLLALYSKINMVTFYGPSVVGTFGEYPNVNQYTLDCLKKIMQYDKGIFSYDEPQEQSLSNYYWDKEDTKKLDYKKFTGWKSNHNGCTEGILVGGNLNTILALIGTEYMPDLENKILFIEDIDTSPSKFYRDMTTLKQNKVFDKINGIICGTFLCDNFKQTEFETILNSFVKKPAIYNVNFGHTNPIMTIPIGINARIDSDKNKIILLESPFETAR